MAQVRLSQVVGTENNVKKSTNEEITAVYHAIQKPEPLNGLIRVYTPKDEDGETYPNEETLVKSRIPDLLNVTANAIVDLFDVTATRDWGNCVAKADITVDGQVIAREVPTTYLLFLEKQLTDLHTLVSKLPTLDPSRRWRMNENLGVYESEPVQTQRTKKIPRNHVKAEATEKHPAQVEVYYEDVPVGTWATTYYSGAIPEVRKRQLLERIEKLQRAVKYAREEANALKVEEQKVGRAFLDYLLAP